MEGPYPRHSCSVEHYCCHRAGRHIYGDLSQKELQNTTRYRCHANFSCPERDIVLYTSLAKLSSHWRQVPRGKFVKRTRDLVLLTLRRVIIPSLKTTFYPKFLFSMRAPFLEHLQIGRHFAWNGFCPPITLKLLGLFSELNYSASRPNATYRTLLAK